MSDLWLVLPIVMMVVAAFLAARMGYVGKYSPPTSAMVAFLFLYGVLWGAGAPWNIALILAVSVGVLTFMVVKVVEYRQRLNH